MPVVKIGQLLTASDELKAVSARTRKLLDLQKRYLESAPAELANASHVKNYRDGILFVAAENAATAAKLRQMVPTLLARISKSEPEVTGVRIGVQVGGRRGNVRTRSQKTALTTDALKKFDALARQVGDENLRSALKRLVQHHRRKGGA
jgi:hypothetical protein